ncbi:unnamed protein product, partial [Adineta steineri]
EDKHPFKKSNEYFPAEELQYIHIILVEIQNEEIKEQIKMLSQLNPPSAYNNKNNNNDDVDEDEDRSSSSSYLPVPRFQIEFAEIYLYKNG